MFVLEVETVIGVTKRYVAPVVLNQINLDSDGRRLRDGWRAAADVVMVAGLAGRAAPHAKDFAIFIRGEGGGGAPFGDWKRDFIGPHLSRVVVGFGEATHGWLDGGEPFGA